MSKDAYKTIVYSALEVANICGVVNQTAINWIRNGYLAAFSTPGGQYRIYLDDLVAFMTSRNMRVPKDLLDAHQKVSAPKNAILIVDDDKGLNSVLAKYMQKKFETITVYQAYDGFEAGSLLTEKKPRCVILDLDLPGVDGFNICKKIRTSDEFANPIVFVVTALQDDDIEERVKKIGADEFFRKPINLTQVADALRKYIN